MTVVPRARSGMSIARDPGLLSKHPISDLLPSPETVSALCHALEAAGLIVAQRTEAGLTVRGSARLLEEVFGHPVAPVWNKYIRTSPRYELMGGGPLRSRVRPDLISSVTVPRSGFELATPEPAGREPASAEMASAEMTGGKMTGGGPIEATEPVQLPGGLVDIGGARSWHEHESKGQGTRVVMVDTGLFAHPHHREYRYQTAVLPALEGLDVAVDERGHGTAMSAALLAMAPCTALTMVKMANATMSFPLAAFQAAVSLRPDIISCSWGTLRHEPQLHLEVANALRLGITVLFAAGNGSTDRHSAMFQSVATPGAITVGGAHVGPDGSMRASNLASSFRSLVFEARAVPDLSGPCGILPNGAYIRFPTQPGSLFDRRNSTYDGTAPDDGWLVSSGTSGATAYAAGVTALAVGAGLRKPGHPLRAADLAAWCVPVTSGRSGLGDECGGRCPNAAVGYGLLRVPAWGG
ncbi:MAG: S8 family serine peptidase [Nocardioides sp.]